REDARDVVLLHLHHTKVATIWRVIARAQPDTTRDETGEKDENRFQMKSALDFLRFASKGVRSRIAMILLIGLAEVAFSLAFVWFSKAIIDIATGDREGNLARYA